MEQTTERKTILVVDDNPITRKLVRITLEQAGYAVLDAPDGQTGIELMASYRPALVLQDVVLPDVDGFELVQRLRAVAGGADVPILAFSGSLANAERGQFIQHGFSDLLLKPVEPSRLVETVRLYLPNAELRPDKPAEGRRVLVVHDDPIQLKLLKVHLEHIGFTATTADDGMEALEQARRARPDIIVSDVLMPRLDGFRFCQALRAEAELADVPVVLLSAAYTEEDDRRLAEVVGASALVRATPDHQEVIEAVLANLGSAPRPPARPVALPAEQYADRVVRQLERQTDRNVDLIRRLTSLEAELGILAGLAQSLAETSAIENLLSGLLQLCADAGGVSRGAAYLVEPDGQLKLCAQLGYSAADEGPLRDLGGHAGLFQRVLATGEPALVAAPDESVKGTHDLLPGAGAGSILVAPLVQGGERLGALVMASEHQELEKDWIAFVRVVGGQIGQAIGLARAMAWLQESEERLAFLAEASSVLAGSLDYDTTLVNVARLAVPFLADWCVVDMAGPDQSIRRVAAVHTDPAKVEWLRRLDRDYPPDPNEPYGPPNTLRTGRSELYPEVPDSALVARARDARHLEIIRQAGVKSAMYVPLMARGRAVGVLSFAMAESGRRYRPADLILAEDLARRAALAVDNARLYGEAQEAVQAREEFLSVAAHELKTPVTSLRGYAQVILRQMDKQDVLDPKIVRRALQVIDQQSGKLARLMTQLLDLSRIEAGKLRLDRHVTDVTALVEGVVASARLQASQHTLAVHAPASMPALIDPLRLEQVVANLVDNAIKYSPDGGPIDVELSMLDAETVRLAVRDRGVGIAPEHRPYIFDRFYQAPLNKSAGGMGLGLYISHEIVRLHGGELIVEFPPDGGTRFVATLLARPDDTPRPKED